jgi:capsular exopolysaccharide synthesis family protein
MVCSAQPGEGKTTVSVGLALTMALAGQRVLLVDADARKPRLRELFELTEKRGFTDVLVQTSKVDVRDVVQRVSLQGDKSAIDVVSSGSHLPAHTNLMASPRLEAFVSAASELYEVVLFDSPPVLAVSDPCYLAPLVSGVIFVVGSGTVQERDAKLAKERIQKAGGRLLGFVMNRFDDSQDGPGYHPYEGYYNNTSKA